MFSVKWVYKPEIKAENMFAKINIQAIDQLGLQGHSERNNPLLQMEHKQTD